MIETPTSRGTKEIYIYFNQLLKYKTLMEFFIPSFTPTPI